MISCSDSNLSGLILNVLEGTNEEAPGGNAGSEDAASEKSSRGKKHRKSSLCVLL